MLKKVPLPKRGHDVIFVHRDAMKNRAPHASARLAAGVPSTPLPVDGTGNMGVQVPMDGNDTLGICGPAMLAHDVGILTYRQGNGVELLTNLAALEQQYLKISGGDNGTDENMLVGPGGIYTAAGGGLAGDPREVCADSLDFDVTDVPLTQYLIDQFYDVKMAWSVPDDFINRFDAGVVFSGTPTPDPANGHYTPLADVDASGNYRCITWGTWCWMTTSYVAGVEPQCFASISPLQFDPTSGLDSKGRHVSMQAAKWVALGGSQAKMTALVAMFPPLTPTPPPPTPPTPTPSPATFKQQVLTVWDTALLSYDDQGDETQVVILQYGWRLVSPLIGAAVASEDFRQNVQRVFFEAQTYYQRYRHEVWYVQESWQLLLPFLPPA
jgi:hypothetical protein